MFLLTSVFVVVVYKTFSSLGLFYYLKQFYGIRIHVACADPCTDEEVEDHIAQMTHPRPSSIKLGNQGSQPRDQEVFLRQKDQIFRTFKESQGHSPRIR